MKNKIISFIFSALIIFFISIISVNATETTSVKLNATDITLYTLSENAKANGISLPSNLKSSFQIQITGSKLIPKYSIPNNDYPYLKVSSDGLITLKEDSADNNGYAMNNKTCHVSVQVGSKTYTIKVTIIDYLNNYVTQKMQDFLNKNITSSMTDFEKAETIAKYIVNNFEYNTNPNFRYVFLTGGGDCIALNSLFIQMLQSLGIKAHIRYAADMPGAGAGHRDAVALLDNKIYYADVSFHDPRDYILSTKPFSLSYDGNGFLYSFISNSNFITLQKYDGFNTENISITPKITVDMIDGPKEYTLKSLASKSFSYACTISDVKVKSVIIPEGVEEIEDDAFSDCTTLEELSLPSTLKTIGSKAFLNTNIKNFKISPNNPYYTFENGILYNKNKTEIIYVSPSLEGELTLLNSVKTIKAYAFAYNKSLTGVILNNNLETIEENAFYSSKIYGLTISPSVKTIGENAFSETNFRYIKITAGSTLNLSDYLFSGAINLKGIYIPESITTIAPNAFRFASSDLILYVEENSQALNYATTNNKEYEIVTNKKINPGMIILKTISYDYDGTAKTPEFIVMDGGHVLKNKEDYSYSFKDNVNAYTTPSVIVNGLNSYNGSAEKTFKINKVLPNVDLEVTDIVYGETLQPHLITYGKEFSSSYYYSSTIPDFWESTKTAPTEVGTYYLLAAVTPKDKNYYSLDLWVKYNILPANNDLDVACPNINYGEQLNIKVIKNQAGSNLTYYYKRQGADDSTYTTTKPNLPGQYTLKVVSAATKNYKETSITKNFKIIGEYKYLKGDINKDTIIDVLDAREALSFAVGRYEVTDQIILSGDMDLDNKITATDAAQILKVYLKK